MRFRMLSLIVAVGAAGCSPRTSPAIVSKQQDSGPTDIVISADVMQSGLNRLGINLGNQSFYDSGQMMRNLVYRNPGFEGSTWQVILRCATATPTSCTDRDQWAGWPDNFLAGANFEFISGAAAGQTGTVTASTAADSKSNQGVGVTFSPLMRPPATNDYLIVRLEKPGHAEEGWWPDVHGGGAIGTEFSDLPPHTEGKQALRITAAEPGQHGGISSYFDSTDGHSFVQMRGPYRLSFRAKGVGGKNQLEVSLTRNATGGVKRYFASNVSLGGQWKTYTFDFQATDGGSAIGTAALSFAADGSSVLLDDVSLEAQRSRENPTAFRDDVVRTLEMLHPGILRYHDSDTYGSTVDNILTPVFGRERAGYNPNRSTAEDLAIGLHEFLKLCQLLHAEPYYDMPPGISPAEVRALMEYLGGPATTRYGARRAALGQVSPWTSVFPVIHLEIGNEQWNYPTFPGAAIDDPEAYAQRVSLIFGEARSSPWFTGSGFDLVMGAQSVNLDRTAKEVKSANNYDSVSVAPYLFNSFKDPRSDEAIFGPMFAQPESIDSVSSGYMQQQSKAVSAAGRKLVVYETQLSPLSGSVPQDVLSRVASSLGAGLAVVDHMLLMMRDLGIKTQSVWELPGFANHFENRDIPNESVPLFGSVVDMGGATNRVRPVFLAEQLANEAILPTMLRTMVQGANPTWNQATSANDDIHLEGAHTLQTFAFADGQERSLVVLNLSRSENIDVRFSGPNAPIGQVRVSVLTAAHLSDGNEDDKKVEIERQPVSVFTPLQSHTSPPHSMTVLRWTKGS